MWPLLVLIYPFAELYTFYRFIDAYSFLDAVLLVITSGLLGVVLLATQGKASIQGLQAAMTQGKIPAHQILHKAVIMLGALMILIPGIISDVIGVLCVLPISRHLIVLYLRIVLARGISKGRMGVFVSGFSFPNDFQFRRGTPRDFSEEPIFSNRPVERDATVVDVTPIEVTHTDKKD